MKQQGLSGVLTILSLGLTVSSQESEAAEAFFSKDGEKVVVAVQYEGGLVEVALASGEVKAAPLPAEFAEKPAIDSVARGSDGEALFLAQDAIWVWQPGSDTVARKVCSTAPVVGPSSVFVSTQPGTPFHDYLFVTGSEEENAISMGTFYGRKPGSKEGFVPVFTRRASESAAGAFSDAGRLFFTCKGDLWEGEVAPSDQPEFDHMGTLVGARIAPLAILNTDEANGGGLWVENVCPAGKWIYTQSSGRHLAAVMRTPMPAKSLFSFDYDEDYSMAKHIEVMSQSLAKTEIITDELEGIFGFCATEVEGKPKVFFCTQSYGEGTGPAMYLWEGSGEPRVIGHLPAE
ncbi:hypothetical protein [Roseibacillus persicicus]|uniref:hypothetical protein n=1 Tax=Roseibacillus persicicus TaxID=454148 RepID=UPI00280DD41C|nr:hypothetical protein [Roseibacillus persicicus]MDQ8192469.1 hypothetical protein [Roseibacillus persicicus]